MDLPSANLFQKGLLLEMYVEQFADKCTWTEIVCLGVRAELFCVGGCHGQSYGPLAPGCQLCVILLPRQFAALAQWKR
jgi:hypothetical protein